MKKLLLFSLLALLALGVRSQSADKPGNWKLIASDEYPAEDVGVATYTVTTDFNADPTGVKNSLDAFQTALTKLGENRRGGVLFVPAGRYRISGKLFIPTGVTMRGEWKRPVKGKPVEGTILMVDTQSGSETESGAFITMEPSTALTHLTIWYPHQDPDNIKPYPPTILYGREGVWGNDYCNVRHVTLVNSYSGIVLSRKNGGGCPNIYDVYGTPLSRGIEIDHIADVGRFEWIHFSPDYWADSGLEGAPQAGEALAAEQPQCRQCYGKSRNAQRRQQIQVQTAGGFRRCRSRFGVLRVHRPESRIPQTDAGRIVGYHTEHTRPQADVPPGSCPNRTFQLCNKLRHGVEVGIPQSARQSQWEQRKHHGQRRVPVQECEQQTAQQCRADPQQRVCLPDQPAAEHSQPDAGHGSQQTAAGKQEHEQPRQRQHKKLFKAGRPKCIEKSGGSAHSVRQNRTQPILIQPAGEFRREQSDAGQ